MWDLEDQIAQVGTMEEKALELKVLTSKERIDDFSKLFQDHKKSSNFFKLMEESCHPQVWFSEVSLDSDRGEVLISGKSPNFQILGQQLFMLRGQDLIKEINLSSLSIGKGGETEFIFSLLLEPQIFK